MKENQVFLTGLEIKVGRLGRGVFATRAFQEGELIETAPVYVFPKDDPVNQITSAFDWYLYQWKETCAVVFGYGSLYNHSFRPNAVYERDLDTMSIRYRALRPIEAGEEVTINYNGDPASRDDVEFDAID